jgi:hypothetical protein
MVYRSFTRLKKGKSVIDNFSLTIRENISLGTQRVTTFHRKIIAFIHIGLNYGAVEFITKSNYKASVKLRNEAF